MTATAIPPMLDITPEEAAALDDHQNACRETPLTDDVTASLCQGDELTLATSAQGIDLIVGLDFGAMRKLYDYIGRYYEAHARLEAVVRKRREELGLDPDEWKA